MTQPLTPEVLVYGFRMADDPQVSPDGRQIAYTLATPDKGAGKVSADVWLCDIDGGNQRRLTFASPSGGPAGRRNAGARWSPDGRQLAFVSDRGAKETSAIFVLPLAGGEARELTRHRGPVTDLAWSPDGTRIAYSALVDPANEDESAPDPEAAPPVRVTSRIDYKQDGRGYLGDTRLQTWVLEVASGERRRLTSDPADYAFPQWSPDGTRLAVLCARMNGMSSQLALLPVTGGEPVLVGPEDGEVAAWAWSPSGDRIIIAGDTQRSWQDDFFVLDVASGDVTRLTDDLPSLPVSGQPGEAPPSQPVWLDERQVLFHAVRAGGSGLHIIDSERGSVEPVAQWQATHGGLSVDAARRIAVQSRATMESLGELHVYDLESGSARTITSYSAPVLAQHPPAGWERIDVHREGETIEAWLLKPPDFDPAKRYPLVLEIHGGPNGFYGYTLAPQHQSLATAGFLVVYSNPRGSSSYGRRFTQMVTEDWGGEDYRDLMAVVDEVAQRPYVDADRLGVAGYSYGGYMTAWIIGQTARFKAAVCGAPCFDLESMYGTSDISHVFGELQWGGAPHRAREWYAAHSPSEYAHRATTPTLIVHGEADERCPIGQGEQMFVALKKAGVDVEFARYPGAAHGFRRGGHPAHREDCWQRQLAWFQRYLGGPR